MEGNYKLSDFLALSLEDRAKAMESGFEALFTDEDGLYSTGSDCNPVITRPNPPCYPPQALEY